MNNNKNHFSFALAAGFLLAALSPVQAHATAPELSETPEITFSDAASHDLAAKAAELKTPLAMYEYVRNNFEYTVYQGSRGAGLNTFLGQRGNDVDMASALIAMLRSQGYPARYAVGTVKRDTTTVENWLRVQNPDVAIALLTAQGIQKVQYDSDKSHIQMEQAWVEVLTRMDNYRGAGSDAQTPCVVGDAHCKWVPLAPAFKLHEDAGTLGLNPLDVSALAFDYTSYYNAIKNNDATRMDKDPLDIYEKQILDYLHTQYPGKTLADVEDGGTVKQESLGLLPLSLPFDIVGTVRHYNSVADHDAQTTGTTPLEAKPWAKYLYLDSSKEIADANGNPIPDPATQLFANKKFLLTDLATHRLTLTFSACSGGTQAVLRMDGAVSAQSACESAANFPIGAPVVTTLRLDGAPDPTGGSADSVITVTYYNEVVGGYYLIGTGGDTSNWSQVHRAAAQLLQANQDYHILNDVNGVPYVDTNGNGVIDSGEPRLLDDQDAMDALTGGLLYNAMSLYFAEAHDASDELGRIDHVIAPIDGWVGIVSSVYDVQYVDGTSYSIMPGGLLIDMKGVQFSTVLRDYQSPLVFADRHFQLLGHIASSLEHEIWQQLTGYDAVSTVHGIQMALANGATLADINPTLAPTAATAMGASAYAQLGYAAAPQAPFVAHTNVPIFNSNYTPYSLANWWSLSPNDGQVHSFVMLKKSVSASTALLDTLAWNYSSSMVIPAKTDLHTSPDTVGYPSFDSLDTYYNSNWARLSALPATQSSTLTMPLPDGYTLGGSAGNLLTNMHDHYFKPTYNYNLFWQLLDKNAGFVASQWAYKPGPLAIDDYSPYFIMSLRQIYYMPSASDTSVHELVLPSKLVTGSTYRFSVYLDKGYDKTSHLLTQMGFEITNDSFIAGGGYVDGSTFIDPAKDTTGKNFNNSQLNSFTLNGLVNNDQIKTPSTADPVSTVTGNMYHDETDFTIHGRGLDYIFTRTYNSNVQGIAGDGKPLSVGWTHSYNMSLKSNDYGQFPNYPSSQAPENGNGRTSSITYTDERGAQANYLVDDLTQDGSGNYTYAITKPKGSFATLTLDAPAAGEDTLAYGNGVQYIFEGGDLRQPGATARLHMIQDAFGDQLSFTYNDQGQLTNISDNLDVPGRTGLTLAYNADGRLATVSDWTGRTWTYGYDGAGNLTSVIDPLQQETDYQYKPGTHLVSGVLHPAVRGGTRVATQFNYYQNDKAFNYSDALGNTETLDYDLFSKSTRVTDARGFYTVQSYDKNGSMTSMREKDGGMLYFTNNADLLRDSKQDALGNLTSYTYTQSRLPGASDTDGQVTQETDALGNTIKTDYGILDQVTKQTDKRGNALVYDYYATTDAGTGAVAGKLQDVKMVSSNPNSTLNGILVSYTYHPSGQLAKKLETITFGSGGSQARVRTTVYAYDAQDLDLTDKYVSGSGTTVHTHYAYDNLGRMVSQTVYRTTSATDPTLIPLTTTIAYDALSRPYQVTDTLGNVTETVYDADGMEHQKLVHYLQPDGSYVVRTLYTKEYDASDHLISQIDTDGGRLQFTYDQTGNLTSQTDADGNIIHYEYDAMGRRTAVIDANGAKTTTKYDLDGHVVAVTDPNGNTTSFTYDALGRQTGVMSQMQAQITKSYDGNGNVLQFAGDTLKDGTNTYDELNRVVSVQQGGATTTKMFDVLGNVIQVKDAKAHATNMVYDDLGRLITVKDPLVETPVDLVTTYTYDEMGNVLTKTDRKGQVTRYTYDAANRLVLTEFLVDGTSETRHYNAFGDLDSVSNQNVTYAIVYDDLHRPLSKTDSRNGRSMSWIYDPAGNLVQKTDFQGDVTKYQYDSTDRLVAMENDAYVQASYQYDKGGRLVSRILSSGARTDYTYDADNKLLTLGNYANDGSLVKLYTYTRDLSGQVKAITTQTSSGTTTVTYGYNAQHFLISASSAGSTTTYGYDMVGNRTTIKIGTDTYLTNNWTASFTYDADNHLTAVTKGVQGSYNTGGPMSYAYDADGNLTDTFDSTGDPMQHLTWDQKNRLLSVNVLEDSDPAAQLSGGGGGGTCTTQQAYLAKTTLQSNTCGQLPGRTINHLAAHNTATRSSGPMLHANTTTQTGGNGSSTPLDVMTYDPSDYRLSKQTSSDAESYYLDGQNLDAVYDGTGTQLQQKFMRGAVVDEILYGYSYSSAGQGTPSVYQHDASTSVVGETGANGQSLATFTYDPFGNVTGYTGTPQSDLLYTGRNGDSDTGYYYYRARYYDPEIGRFISEDPKGFGAGVNFYAYADNNPLLENDPTGFNPDPNNLSDDCLDGLDFANKSQSAVARADALWPLFVAAGNASGLPPSFLAAECVMESNCQNIWENGDGDGAGYMQIDMGSWGDDLTDDQAFDPATNINFAANLLATNMHDIQVKLATNDPYPAFTPTQMLQATAASFNMRGAIDISGNPDTIDVGTTPPGDYGAKVVGIMPCFVNPSVIAAPSAVSDDGGAAPAAGGYVIYPDKLNLNASQAAVYAKP